MNKQVEVKKCNIILKLITRKINLQKRRLYMRIAVTGGTGFLGQYVAADIKKIGNTPIILTRRSICNKNVAEYRKTDYSQKGLIKILGDIDAVIHLAANRSSQDKITEFHNNETLTQNLYEACNKCGIKNIVYASTISVYSEEELLPWEEVQRPSPKLMYGVSKTSCEYIGNIYSSKEGLYIKNLRFAHLYGFNEKNNYMINRFFRQAYNKEQLTINGESVARREFLYAKDASKAVCCALEKETMSGTFNIGSNEALTNYEVAEKINTVFENKGNLCIKDLNVEEGIQSSYMDNSRAKEILHFLPDYSFLDGIEKIYRQMKVLDYVPLFY